MKTTLNINSMLDELDLMWASICGHLNEMSPPFPDEFHALSTAKNYIKNACTDLCIADQIIKSRSRKKK